MSQKEKDQDQYRADHGGLQVEKDDPRPEEEERQRDGDREDRRFGVSQAGEGEIGDPEQEDQSASDQDDRGLADQVDMYPGRGIETAQ